MASFVLLRCLELDRARNNGDRTPNPNLVYACAWFVLFSNASYHGSTRDSRSRALLGSPTSRIPWSLLIWLGTGLAFTNWIIIGVLSILFLAVYIYRIRVEEVMLISAFGER